MPAGGTAVFAAGTRHNWWNAGDDLLEFSGQATPAVDLDRYLQGVFAVVNASPNGRPSIFYMAHVLWRHRNSQLFRLRPKPFSASFSRSFCSSALPRQVPRSRVGPVRPIPYSRCATCRRRDARSALPRARNFSESAVPLEVFRRGPVRIVGNPSRGTFARSQNGRLLPIRSGA